MTNRKGLSEIRGLLSSFRTEKQQNPQKNIKKTFCRKPVKIIKKLHVRNNEKNPQKIAAKKLWKMTEKWLKNYRKW